MAILREPKIDSASGREQPRVLSETEFSVLRCLALYELLTAEQVCRLFFSYPGSLRYAQELLRRLCDDDELLLRSYVPKPNPGGRARYVWRLSNSGRRVLKEAGLDVRQRFRPSEGPVSRLALEHLLGTTDYCLSLTKLCQPGAGLSVAVRPEWMLKGTNAVKVRDGDRDVVVIPDAYLVVSNDRGQRLNLLYEHDMGTEGRAKLSTKLRHLIAFAKGPCKAYGAEVVTIAILAPTPARAQQILTWLEPVLRSEHAEDLADAFWVAGASVTATSPRDLFLSPLWRLPLHDGQYALLEALL